MFRFGIFFFLYFVFVFFIFLIIFILFIICLNIICLLFKNGVGIVVMKNWLLFVFGFVFCFYVSFLFYYQYKSRVIFIVIFNNLVLLCFSVKFLFVKDLVLQIYVDLVLFLLRKLLFWYMKLGMILWNLEFLQFWGWFWLFLCLLVQNWWKFLVVLGIILVKSLKVMWLRGLFGEWVSISIQMG